MSDDGEAGGGAEFMFTEESVRRGFIKKVYGILTVQLVITFGIVCIMIFIPSIKDYVYEHTEVFWTAFGLTIACMIVLSCCGDFRRKAPWNFVVLIIFTLCEGYMLGSLGAMTDSPREVSVAIVMTIVVAVGLTIFAFQTKVDFTMFSGLLFTLVLILITFGIFALIFRSDTLYLFYCALGALVFCFFIVFDTQLMLGGKHKFTISPEEYIFAALNLYLDVINLFMYLLAIISGGR